MRLQGCYDMVAFHGTNLAQLLSRRQPVVVEQGRQARRDGAQSPSLHPIGIGGPTDALDWGCERCDFRGL